MNVRVRFIPDNVEIVVPRGMLLSSVAKLAGIFIDSPCGGNGTCEKCAVSVQTEYGLSRVLACQTRAERDCSVTLPARSGIFALSHGKELGVAFEPYPEADTSSDGACFACFDLGTTTIVCYLLDAKTGVQLQAAGRHNPQAAYGADVIARANHTLSTGSPDELKSCAVNALNELILETTRSAGRTPEQVVMISIVGNTVMHHLLLGLPVGQLVRAPYVPFDAKRRIAPAYDLGLIAGKNAKVLLAPVVGGFVGADTVACMTATAFDRIAIPALLIDIGTNGELVLTDGTRRACCSTAAGPAFEGANISCGMRAEQGAIDHVWLEDGKLTFSTIGRVPARGICGSGLIDLCAVLVKTRAVDESGRMIEPAPNGMTMIALEYGMCALLLHDGEQRVTFSQKDVRELQLGKAAMRAGIEVLLNKLSLTADQIGQVLLAGAFGAHLSSAALCEIGLLPMEFLGRVESIGNAAGEGAKIYTRNFSLFEASSKLAQETEYIELTLSPAFNDYFIDSISFENSEK